MAKVTPAERRLLSATARLLLGHTDGEGPASTKARIDGLRAALLEFDRENLQEVAALGSGQEALR